MSEHQPGRVRLTVTQVLGGAVAAMVGSLVASRLGVTGTILGAAIVSVVATVVTAVNINSMNHVRERARTARRALAEARLAEARRSRMGLPDVTAAESEETRHLLEDAENADLADLAALDEEEARDAAVEGGPLAVADRRGLHWGAIAIVSVLVFVLAMVGITVVEKITGQSIACSLGADCDRPTTVPLPGRPAKHSPKPTPTPTPTDAVTPTPTPSVTVSDTPTPTESAVPTGTPTPTDTGIAPATPTAPQQSQPEASP